MRNWIFFLLTLLLLPSCYEDTIYKEPELVVEGWIDEGGFPIVMVTTTLGISNHYQDMESINDNIIKWAKVTVDDGEKEVILTGMVNREYEPPYIYTTTEMRGKTGRRYKIKVDYKAFHAEAETTIPPTVKFNHIEVKEVGGTGHYQILATINDPIDTDNYYKLFVRNYHKESYYLSFYPDVYHDKQPEIHNGISITRGTKSGTELENHYFEKNDTVLVKLCNIDEPSYRFWKDYEKSSALARVPFFPIRENIKNNVKGGLGYWCGYGANEFMVIINDYITTQNLAK